MKKIVGSLLSVLMLLAQMTPAFALTPHAFKIVAYDEKEHYLDERGELITSTVKPGQIFRVDVHLEHGSEDNINAMVSGIKYPADLLDIIIEEEENVKAVAGDTEAMGGIYPAPRRGGGVYWKNDFSYPEPGLIKVLHSKNPLDPTITKSGTVMYALFKVKENVAPGTEIKIENHPGSQIAADTKTLASLNLESLSLSVEGETPVIDTSLKSLNVIADGSSGGPNVDGHDYMEALFDESKETYNLVVPSQVTKIRGDVVLNDTTTQGVTLDFGKFGSANDRSLVTGNNEFNAVVKYQGSTQKTYKINVLRLSDDAELAKDSANKPKISGTSDDGSVLLFDTNNTAKIKQAAKTVNVNPILQHASATYTITSNATVTGNVVTLNSSTQQDTVFTVNIKAQSAQSEYASVYGNVPVTKTVEYKLKRGSNDTKLSLLSIAGEQIVLVDNQFNYSVTVANTISSAQIVAQTAFDGARVFSSGLTDTNPSENRLEAQKSLTVGSNSVTLDIRAEDGTIATYTVIITRDKSATNTLKSLSAKLDSVEKIANFQSTTNQYNLGSIPFKENATLNLSAAITDGSNASFVDNSILKNHVLKSGLNQFKIDVKAENGAINSYTVSITMEPNSSSEIGGETGNTNNPFTPKPGSGVDKIEADPKGTDGKPVDPNGQGDGVAKDADSDVNGNSVYRFTVNVPNSTTSFSMNSINFTLPSNATLTGGDEVSLSTGSNTFTFTVQPEDASKAKSVYIFTVIRAKSNSATLASLTTNAGTFDKTFSPSTKSYVLNVASNVNELTLTAKAANNGTVKESNVVQITTESTPVSITVTSEDGLSSDTYTVLIKREKSTINTLGSIKLDDTEILSQFQNDRFTQVYGTDKATVTLDVQKSDSRSSVSINDVNGETRTIDLVFGENTIRVDSISESGIKKTYTLVLTRSKDSNANLSDLKIGSSTIAGFSKDTLTYTVDQLPNNVKTINVEAIAENTNATTTIVGNTDLKVGNNVITITVTAQDGTTKKTYSLNVTRSAADIGENGLIPGNQVESITKDTTIVNPEPNNYYYVAYVPSNKTQFTKSDVVLSNAIIQDGYAIKSYHNDPLTLSKTGTNVFKFDVETQSKSYAGTYNIRVVFLNVDPPQIDSIKIDGTQVVSYNKETEFTLDVDQYLKDGQTSFEFEIVPSAGTTLGGSLKRTIDLKGVASKKVPITITDTVTSLVSVYEFTFTKTLSKDTALSSLTIDGLKESGGMVSLSLNHELNEEPFDLFEIMDVASDIDSVSIKATPSNSQAKILNGQGEFELKPGANVFSVIVQAEDQSVPAQKYQITIHRAIALTELKLGDKPITLSNKTVADDGTIIYTVTDVIDSNSYIHTLSARANHASIQFSGDVNRQVELSHGMNYLNFEATAQDGITKQKYRVQYTRTASNDARLKSLSLSGTDMKLEPAFSPEVFEYSIEVPYTKDTWLPNDATWVAMHGKTVVQADPTITINDVGETIYTIKTTSESNDSKTYTLKLRKVGYNFLSDLHVGQNQGALTPEFDPEVMKYDASIYAGISTFRVYYTLDDRYGAKVLNSEALENIPVSSLPRNIEIQVQAKNGEIRTYEIYAEQGVSTRLSTLTTNDGVMSPTFSPNTLEYDIYVADDIHTITFNPTVEDPQAKVEGTYENVALITGTNIVKMIVRNGNYTSEYVVRVHKVVDKTGIGSVAVTYGKQKWEATWNETDSNYSVSLPENVDLEAILVEVKTSDPNSNYELADAIVHGNTVHYIIKVTDENNISKRYTLVVNRESSDDNYLKILQIDGENVVGFDKATLDYSYKIDKKDIRVTAVAEDSNAKVEVKYPETFANGSVVEIIVTSARGSVRTYKITLSRDADNTALLDRLSVVEGTISPKFNPLQNDYYLTIPNEIDAINPVYVGSETITVTIENSEGIPVGDDHIVNVVVKAENGDTNTYKIHVTRQSESQNYLESLAVSGSNHGPYSLTPTFKKNINTYIIEAQDEDMEFEISAIGTENTVVNGSGTLTVVDYPYTHEIRVVGSDNIPRLYTIMFTRKASSDTSIGNLWTDHGTLDPVFDVSKTAYNVDVPFDVEEIEIFASKTYDAQTILNTGVHTLSPGRNTIEIEIVAEDATSKVYTLFINRAQDQRFGLETLTVSEGELSPSFDPSIKQYFVDVDANIESIEINGSTPLQDATILGLGTKDLKPGSNEFKIEVTRERNETATYYIVVNRGIQTSNYLAVLELENGTLNESFSKDIQSYTTTFESKDLITVKLNAVPEDSMARVTVTGNENLGQGTHEIQVHVSREGLEDRVYTIQVSVETLKLESDMHVIGEEYIQTIISDQTVEDVKNQMLNPNEYLEIYKNGVLLESTDLVGTGSVIKLVKNEKSYDERVLIVKGDVNGDGRIGVADIINLRTYILGGTLTDVQIVAADINTDDKAGVADLIAIRSHILGTINLFDKKGDQS